MKMLIVFVLTLQGLDGCLYHTFSNTSVILSGVSRRFPNVIDGCFSPVDGLESVSFIQIINQTVPVLYEEAFSNLDFLLDIILENDGVREIKPGTFKNLPKLYLIRLKNNEIRMIREGVFNNLTISELSLINNQIEVVETRAFNDLRNLNILLLGDNKITNLDPNWFQNCPKLSVLNFEKNFITQVPPRAFQNIKGVHVVNKRNVSTSIHLNNNKIRMIDDDAFDGLDTLGWLFLQRNEINEFRAESLGNLTQLDWLRLDHNNLQCIPERMVEIVPNVIYYLEDNPITDECITRFNIKKKGNGAKLNKFHVSIN